MDKLNYIGTVDAGFIRVRVGVFTVEQEIDVSVVIGRGQLFHFELNPKEADLLSTRLLRVCESTLDCSDTFETPSVHLVSAAKTRELVCQ